MTFDDYQKAALRTANMTRGADIEMCIRALGLCGELVELRAQLNGRTSDFIKEGGDVLWYAATLADMFHFDGARFGVIDLDDFDMVDFMHMTTGAVLEHAQDAAGMIAELVKKHVGHGKPADPLKIGVLLQLIISAVRHVMPISLVEVGRENIAKLQARYPQGFRVASDDNAGRLNHDAPWKPGPV